MADRNHEPYSFENTLLQGDAMHPSSTDLIAQLAQLRVGSPVPKGWRVLTGNSVSSTIARIAYRYEIETETDARMEVHRPAWSAEFWEAKQRADTDFPDFKEWCKERGLS